MKKITHPELLALLPKVREFVEQRLERDDVDGMIVFEREGRRTACVFGEPYTFKNWSAADGQTIEIRQQLYRPVAYYQKP